MKLQTFNRSGFSITTVASRMMKRNVTFRVLLCVGGKKRCCTWQHNEDVGELLTMVLPSKSFREDGEIYLDHEVKVLTTTKPHKCLNLWKWCKNKTLVFINFSKLKINKPRDAKSMKTMGEVNRKVQRWKIKSFIDFLMEPLSAKPTTRDSHWKGIQIYVYLLIKLFLQPQTWLP